MEQQQPAANERSSRPLVRLPHSTRSFSRSRSRSPSRHDDEDGANGNALSRPAGWGDSGDEPSHLLGTAPVSAEEPGALLRFHDLQQAAIVHLPLDHEDLFLPVHESLSLSTVCMTPAYLIYLAADSDLPALMKLMKHVAFFGDYLDLDVHLDIEVVASYFAGPETMEAARLMELVDYGVDRFQQWASMSEKNRWLDLPALALLRIHAMVLQDVGGPHNIDDYMGGLFYESPPLADVRPELLWLRWSLTSFRKVQIDRSDLGRMIQLIKEDFFAPRRGFMSFFKFGPRQKFEASEGPDRDFTNFLHTFIRNVRMLADNNIDESAFIGFKDYPHQTAERRRVIDHHCGFDETIYYVHRKHIATLGELLQECWQLAASRPFDPKYYRPDQDERKLDVAVAATSESGEPHLGTLVCHNLLTPYLASRAMSAPEPRRASPRSPRH